MLAWKTEESTVITSGPLSLRQRDREKISKWGKYIEGSIFPLRKKKTPFLKSSLLPSHPTLDNVLSLFSKKECRH